MVPTRILREDPHTPRFKNARASFNKRGKKFGPNRSKNYLEWIRKLPCCVCGANAPSEASHHGPRGMGQKTSDFRTVPLCNREHTDWHQHRCFKRAGVGYDTTLEAEVHVLKTIVALHDRWWAELEAA